MKMLIVAVLLTVCWAGSPIPDGYEVGDTATDFKLKNIDGKMVSLADYKSAKGFIIVFDCNTCPYSKAYSGRIIALNKKYASLGFPVVAINPNDQSIADGDSFEEMVKVAKKKGYDFPYLVDESQSVAKNFGATNTPHVFVLTKELKLVYKGTIDDNARNEGAVTKRYAEDAVDALLSGKPVPVTKTKAIGCGIKWKSV
jgi:peroxiredoxin